MAQVRLSREKGQSCGCFRGSKESHHPSHSDVPISRRGVYVVDICKRALWLCCVARG